VIIATRNVFAALREADSREQACAGQVADSGSTPSPPQQLAEGQLSRDHAVCLVAVFATALFQQPARSTSIAMAIDRRLAWIAEGDWQSLFEDAGLLTASGEWLFGPPPDLPPRRAPLEVGHLPRPAEGPVGPSRNRRFRRALLHVRSNQTGRAMEALRRRDGDVLDPAEADVESHLRELHPPLRGPLQPPEVELPADGPVSAGQLDKALRSMPHGAGAGVDGWRYEHFRLSLHTHPALSDDAGSLKQALHGFVLIASAGRLPEWYRSTFATARITLIRKRTSPGQPASFRPVACGSALRRLTGRAVLVDRGTDLLAGLNAAEPGRALQLGVAVANAPEGIALAGRQGLARGQHVLKFDSKAAFQNIDRRVVLEEVVSRLPWLAPLALYLYGAEVPLLVPASHGRAGPAVSSCNGVAQGCPLGNLLFCLALQPTLQALREHLDEVARDVDPPPLGLQGCTDEILACEARRQLKYVLTAYCDDVIVIGPPRIIAAALAFFPERVAQDCGLSVNFGPGKSFVYPPLPEAPETDIEQIPADQGVDLLGIPVGAAEWVGQHLQRSLDDVVADIGLVEEFVEGEADGRNLYHLQAASLMLIRAVLPRMTYHVRASRPEDTQLVAEAFDLAFTGAAARMFGLSAAELADPTSVLARTSALSHRMGGMAWRRLVPLRDVAFVAAATAAARVARTVSTEGGTPPMTCLQQVPFATELGIMAARERLERRATTLRADLDGEASSANYIGAGRALDKLLRVELRERGAEGQRLQHILTLALERAERRKLVDELAGAARSHLEGASWPGAMAFATVAPATDELRMANRDFRTAVQRALFAPVLSVADVGRPCPKKCFSTVGGRRQTFVLEASGAHAFSCSRGGKTQRHEGLKATVADAALATGATTVSVATSADIDQEPRAQPSGGADGGGAAAAQGGREHLPDLVVKGSGGACFQDTLLDVFIIMVERERLSNRLTEQLNRKGERYAAGAARLGRKLVRFGVNNLGGLCEEANGFLKDLTRLATSHSTDPDAPRAFAAYWRARISIRVHQLAANSVAQSLLPLQPGANVRAYSQQPAMDLYSFVHLAGRNGARGC
jgi:hypothetical protein